jgi:hypothetical protein
MSIVELLMVKIVETIKQTNSHTSKLNSYAFKF